MEGKTSNILLIPINVNRLNAPIKGQRFSDQTKITKI